LIFVFFNYSFGSIDTLEKELVENSTDSIVADSINVVSNSYNFSWGIIFFILIVIIGLYILQLYQKKTTIYQIDKKIIEDNNENNNESWGSVFNSINEQPEAKKKYDELIRKCHPDRFPSNNKKIRIATKLSAELSEHKLDLTKLKELEHRINRELY